MEHCTVLIVDDDKAIRDLLTLYCEKEIRCEVMTAANADEALKMAVQTAKGAADLLLQMQSHPEHEIDKVTSPKGCTIAGLNEMEHNGFSSAMIKGIKLSAEKAGELYK